MTLITEPPLVVGTIRPAGLAALVDAPPDDDRRVADIIEVRLDLAGAPNAAAGTDTGLDAGAGRASPAEEAATLALCRRLQETGAPVLATIRLVADGGGCAGDAARLPRFEAALAAAGWVDIEIDSAIATDVIARARDRGRQVIVSHHDLAATPPLGELGAIADRALARRADVVKIATLVRSLEDHDRLLDFVRARRGQPLAIVGMGPIGTPLRSYLPAIGSRLAYGYLDRVAAPGQIHARELVARLVSDCPDYAESRRARRQT